MTIRSLIRSQPAVFLALLLVSACANGPQTHHFATEPIEMHKMFVLGGLGTEDNNAYAASFVGAITSDIQACGIEVKAENVPDKDRSLSLDADPFVAVNADIAHFAPNGVLRVTQRKAGGLIDSFNGVGTIVNVMLINPARSPKEGGPMLWNGVFKTDSELSAAKGAALAHDIVNKMKQDNVVKGCN